MKIETYIDSLISYAMNCGLAEPVDHVCLVNRLLEVLKMDDYTPSEEPLSEEALVMIPFKDEILSGRDGMSDSVRKNRT